MNKSSVSSLLAVYAFPADSLPDHVDFMIMAGRTPKLPDLEDAVRLDVAQGGKLTISDSIKGNRRLKLAELSFTSPNDLPDFCRYAFVALTGGGGLRLLGRKENPGCSVSMVDHLADDYASACAYDYTVKFSGLAAGVVVGNINPSFMAD